MCVFQFQALQSYCPFHDPFHDPNKKNIPFLIPIKKKCPIGNYPPKNLFILRNYGTLTKKRTSLYIFHYSILLEKHSRR